MAARNSPRAQPKDLLGTAATGAVPGKRQLQVTQTPAMELRPAWILGFPLPAPCILLRQRRSLPTPLLRRACCPSALADQRAAAEVPLVAIPIEGEPMGQLQIDPSSPVCHTLGRACA